MHIVSGSVPHARRLARVGVELSRSARLRLQWMDHYEGRGGNAAFTCRHFGISRQTFYRWRRRYDPRRSREPTWTRELALARCCICGRSIRGG